jgi:hypothetical protein
LWTSYTLKTPNKWFNSIELLLKIYE